MTFAIGSVDYENGTEKVDVLKWGRMTVWPNGTRHSHSSADGKYSLGDIGISSSQKGGCGASFFNVVTAKEIDIVSSLPGSPYTHPIHTIFTQIHSSVLMTDESLIQQQ